MTQPLKIVSMLFIELTVPSNFMHLLKFDVQYLGLLAKFVVVFFFTMHFTR